MGWEQFNESKKGDIDPDAEVRNRGNCVFPAEDSQVNDNEDHFPINDKAQARNALARANQYDSSPDWFDGTLKELKERVVKAVEDEYPSIEVDEEKDTD